MNVKKVVSINRTMPKRQLIIRGESGYKWVNKHGVRHCDSADQPAMVKCGNRYWCKDGVLHRRDKPAVVLRTGEEYWYQYGLEYNIDRKTPAIGSI